MSRKPIIRTNEYFYHITSRSNQKIWYSIPLERVWEISQRCLKVAYDKHGGDILQFVLMSNHYHLLIRTPNANIDKFIYELNKNFSLLLRIETQLINKMFGGRYHWSLIKEDKKLLMVYRYIYQNPLRAKMVEKCEDYPFSTLKVRLSEERGFSVPLSNPPFDDRKLLDWMNEKIDEDTIHRIRQGLKKKEFKEVYPRKY